MANNKLVGSNDLAAKLLKPGIKEPRTILMALYGTIATAWRRIDVSQNRKDRVTKMLYEEQDRTECINYRGIAQEHTPAKSYTRWLLAGLATTARRRAPFSKSNTDFSPSE